ncbi:MAG: glycosyltransferase family 2 protein [Patescibacteria group bacterium]
MPRKDSIIMSQCLLSPKTRYKIIINASRMAGNGNITVNFYSGKNYDGNQIPLIISSSDIREYAVTLCTPDVSNTTPMYIRICRPDNSTGCIFVKSIKIVSIEKAENTAPARKFAPQSIIFDKDGVKVQFKRIKKRRHNEFADKVLIKKPEDVSMVSIITPTRDNLEVLKKCHLAIIKNTHYPNWEWVIGDSSSSDETAEYIKQLNDSRIKIISRGTSEGSFSSINNELADLSSGEFLLFLNDDTEPQPFWMTEMMSNIKNNKKIGIVGARLEYCKDAVQHAGIVFIPDGPANLGKSVLKYFPEGFANHDRFFQAVTGACLLINKEDFYKVGGFDEAYYFCYEDVDLCLKVVHELGKKILYAANAVVIHSESVSQNKFKTSGTLQQNGIKIFKTRWMHRVDTDFTEFKKNINKDIYQTDISFVTCVNNIEQYNEYVIHSLYKNITNKKYEIVPIYNMNNQYSASQALNIGISKARGNVVVLCHQDVLFYEKWIDMLFDRISEIEKTNKKWGVLGTAGINQNDDTIGVVHNMKGKIQWQSTKSAKVYLSQTLDEHCMVIRKNSGLKFDEKTFDGFHFYGADIALSALDKGMLNYGILCPLVHESSGSLFSGKDEFMRLLNALSKKWQNKFKLIRTPTSIIDHGKARTFIKFKEDGR